MGATLSLLSSKFIDLWYHNNHLRAFVHSPVCAGIRSNACDLGLPVDGIAFRRACKKLKIDNLHFHDLRHEATTARPAVNDVRYRTSSDLMRSLSFSSASKESSLTPVIEPWPPRTEPVTPFSNREACVTRAAAGSGM